MIIRGGWSVNIDIYDENAALLPEQYLNAVIYDDIYRIDGIKRDAGKMRLLLRSLARNESTTATNRTLKNDIKEIDDADIDIDTVASYLDIFERLFLTDNQLPFDSNIRSSARIKKAKKRHLADPSLACALLKATPQKLIGDLVTFGFMFEALCERDLKIYTESFGASLYHYQDYANRELDAVIELSDGRWCAIEIKLGANKIDDAAANLVNLRDAITEDGGVPPSVLCIICGMSNAAYHIRQCSCQQGIASSLRNAEQQLEKGKIDNAIKQYQNTSVLHHSDNNRNDAITSVKSIPVAYLYAV